MTEFCGWKYRKDKDFQEGGGQPKKPAVDIVSTTGD